MSWRGTAWWLRIQLPVGRCHQKSGSVTGWMAAISIVRKMAIVKKCGRSSQRTARLRGPGSGARGAAGRARVANLHDERNEPAGVPGIGLVLRVGGAQDPLLEMGADDLSGKEDGEDQDVQGEQGGQHQSETGDDLAQVDRVADQPVGTARHQPARLGDDAESFAG